MDTQRPGSAQPFAAPSSARPGNGLAVAALVLGVASLVAGGVAAAGAVLAVLFLPAQPASPGAVTPAEAVPDRILAD